MCVSTRECKDHYFSQSVIIWRNIMVTIFCQVALTVCVAAHPIMIHLLNIMADIEVRDPERGKSN